MHLRPPTIAFAATLTLTVTGVASGPTFWTVATAADFLAGRSEGAVVNLHGVVTAGPRLTNRLSAAPPQVWSLASAPDGTLWAGTGGDGRVLKLEAGQSDATVLDADEANVFALVADDGRIFAGTGPDGRVHVIEPDGTSRVFFDPEEPYVWALLVDRDGRLWVGAGNPAVIYRLDASGAGEPVYRPPAAHVVSLALDSDGRLLAGTESPGRLYRLDASGRPFVLLDSGLSELRAIVSGTDGVVFAAAVSREGTASPGEPASVAAASPAPSGAPGPAEPPPSSRSQVFRIAADGTWETLWTTSDIAYDLAPAGDGGLLVATGPEGRLFRVGPDREVSLVTGVDAGQITRFARPLTDRPAGFATANPGRVMTIGDEAQSPATYISRVHDTRTVATWGLIRWEAVGAVIVSTRSGNTARPDDSWSDWSAPYTAGAGSPVASPPARFVQWRAVLESAGSGEPPRLSAVTLAYLPRNTRPVVASLTVHPPGVVFQRPFANEDGAIAGLDDLTAATRRPPGDAGPPAAAPGRRMFQRGLQTLAWKAEDADADRLTYTLRYRRDGETDWRELRRGLLDTIFVWDTTAVPDGRYVVRVEATDELSNTAERALVGHLDSEAIVVDNTPPVITTSVAQDAGGTRILVEVRDAVSPIQKLEYAVAGGPWQLVYPTDGLADSPFERYEIRLGPDRDARDVVVRATDALQNVASAPVVR